jgi:hypothetical protein|tara:strand:- start:320 stop:532 length:213 start_codon:yes stop_codon:yes gene_type:complete
MKKISPKQKKAIYWHLWKAQEMGMDIPDHHLTEVALSELDVREAGRIVGPLMRGDYEEGIQKINEHIYAN